MSKPTISTEEQNALQEEITTTEWALWVRSYRPGKLIDLKVAEERVAQHLGLPTVPRGGKLSLGWCLRHMMGRSPERPRVATPEVVALMQLAGLDKYRNTRMPGTAALVFCLMTQRESVKRYRHNMWPYLGSHDEETNLFDGTWLRFHEDILQWAMANAPLDFLERQEGEYITRLLSSEGKLHSTEGPACVTSKTRKVYALFGVAMTDREYSYRGLADQILKVTNSEVQRALIQDMGLELFIQESGMRPYHKDDTGSLYRIESKHESEWERARRHMCWVHVSCPSTGRDYMLAVPPNTRTAREGVAWTFGKLPEEYQPQQET